MRCVTAVADKLEELPVYVKAMEFWHAVNAMLKRPAFGRDRKLRDQLSNANDSIPSNMHEGFEQSTDRAFANYLIHSKASPGEVLVRLKQAHFKDYVSLEELTCTVDMGEELGRMLGGFIRYLLDCDWTRRGSFKSPSKE